MTENPRAWRPMRTAPRIEDHENRRHVQILVATVTGPEIVSWRWNVVTKRYGWCRDGAPWLYDEDPGTFWGWQPIDPTPKRKVL